MSELEPDLNVKMIGSGSPCKVVVFPRPVNLAWVDHVLSLAKNSNFCRRHLHVSVTQSHSDFLLHPVSVEPSSRPSPDVDAHSLSFVGVQKLSTSISVQSTVPPWIAIPASEFSSIFKVPVFPTMTGLLFSLTT